MDWKAELERILSKDVVELIQVEIDFLKARRDYLTDEQKAKFAQFLGGAADSFRQPDPSPTEQPTSQPDATPNDQEPGTQPNTDAVATNQPQETTDVSPTAPTDNGMGSDAQSQPAAADPAPETVTPQDYNGQPLNLQEPVEPIAPPAEPTSESVQASEPDPAAQTQSPTQWSDPQPQAAPAVAPETPSVAAETQTDNQAPATDYGQLDHSMDPDYKA